MARDFIRASLDDLLRWREELETARTEYNNKVGRLNSMVNSIKNNQGSFSGTVADIFVSAYEKEEDFINVQTPANYTKVIQVLEDEIAELKNTTSRMESDVSF